MGNAGDLVTGRSGHRRQRPPALPNPSLLSGTNPAPRQNFDSERNVFSPFSQLLKNGP
ncbi:hypothetical protein SBA3_3190004 [Candidatus Sulfopaludibacter sp. SbA3]|nr:hypothetical protein SBA3_3190004 [Candidatus Sulfopaludibacter sp. SbA3]